MSSVKALVDKLIAGNTMMIFSKSYCPYCTNAKELASKLSIPFKAIELDHEDNGSDIQDYLRDITKQSTVPNIFIKGQHIGGFSEFKKAEENGTVKKLLA